MDFEILPGQKVSTICRRLDEVRVGLCDEIRDLHPVIPCGAEPPPDSRRPDAGLRRLEGMLAPGTYALSPDDPAAFRAALQAASADHVRYLRDRLGDRTRSTYEMLTLASIVQKESVVGKNLPRVADVFVNRLDTRMRLQSCPTVEYALGFHRPYLLTRDVQVPSPYNTYIHKGLPPTPIGTVSREAMDAVVNPAGTDAVFLVFDWTTLDHAFAADLATHQENAKVARSSFVRMYGSRAMRIAYPDLYYEPISR